MDNIRRRIVGVMFPPSIFEDRCVDFRRSMCRLSKIDVSPFEDLVSRASVYFARAEINEKTEAKYTVWSDKTGFRFSCRNLWQSDEIAGWLMCHVTTEKARD